MIDFDENTAFPVVADPSAWQITKCVAAVTWLVGSTVFAAAKIVKIKKYIKALGGMKEAVVIMMGATSGIEKSEELGKAALELASAILGVDTIVDNCPGVKATYKKLKKKFK